MALLLRSCEFNNHVQSELDSSPAHLSCNKETKLLQFGQSATVGEKLYSR